MTTLDIVLVVLGISWVLGFWSVKDIVIGIKELRGAVREEPTIKKRKKKELSDDEIKNILNKMETEKLKNKNYTGKWEIIQKQILKEREEATKEV